VSPRGPRPDGALRDRLAAVPPETALVVAVVSGSHVVNHMYLVLLPPIVGVLATEFGLTVGTVGLAMGAVGVTNVTLQLPFGYLADTRSRTMVLAASLSFGAVGAALVALADGFWALVAGQLVLGVGVAAHHPAHFPLLSDATPEAYRGRVFSIHSFAGNVGFAAPPAVVAAVVGVPGLTWRHAVGLVAAVGALYAVLAVGLLAWRVGPGVRHPPERQPTDGDPPAARIRRGVRTLVDSRIVLALALFAFVSSTAGWGVTAYAVEFLTGDYGVSRATANLALSGTFVAGAVAVLAGGELADRVAAGPVLLGSFAATTLLLVALSSLLLPALVALSALVAVGATRSAASPARSKLTDAASARGSLGRNFAVVTVGVMLGNAVAPPAFGAIVDAAGRQAAFHAITAVALLATLVAAAVIRLVGDEHPTAAASTVDD